MAEDPSGTPEFTPDGPLQQRRNNHRPRRGRVRQDHDRTTRGFDHVPIQNHGQFYQGFNPLYANDGLNHHIGSYPPQHHHDWVGGRGRRSRGGGGGRGRGRFFGEQRESNTGTWASGFGQQSARWPRYGADQGDAGGIHRAEGPPAEGPGPDGPSWRSEAPSTEPGPPSEDHQDTRPKKSRKFSQESRRGEPGERRTKGGPIGNKRENQENRGTGGGDCWEEAESAGGESKLDGVRYRRDGDRTTHPGDPKKWAEHKHRHGPLRSPRPLEEASAHWRDDFQDRPPHLGPDKDAPPRMAGRGRGKGVPLQDVGQRRSQNQNQNHRPNQGKSDGLPKSKETQTGCLIEQLSAEKYECMVCCDVIRHMAPVWSCQGCYHVFHLNCIKKWARSPASLADDVSGGWRCPACQNVATKNPGSYVCFCGKVTNPEWQRSEIPHSCGDMCGKKRSGVDCNHPCNILCHPGPCPQCPAFVTKACVCGKTSQPMRCGQAPIVRCDNVCGTPLSCAEHTCAQVCHSGDCQSCQLQVQQVCYCGAASREVPCGTGRDGFDGCGHFSCQKLCGKMLACHAHQCQQQCHSGPCQPCPLSPSLLRSCPCGQTSLAKLLELGYPERRTCSDPVPSCGKTCGLPLPCGSDDTVHTCEKMCHEGSCGPCTLTSTVRCRCGSKTKEVPCSSIQKEDELLFTCEKRCNKKRSCGRHKCGELCCVSADHKCSMICGYKLNCGLHRCQELCHRGNCGRCWQTGFDELACYCGQTVTYPPIPCGTKPPECKNLCTRRHDCDHPVFHNCHSEDKCPPCTYLTQKWCMGRHEQRSNIPCHLQDISCGLVCNSMLPCEAHRCRRICHRGPCQAEDACHQPCTRPRPDCGHPCAAPCHKGAACPRTTCTAQVTLQCDCGRRTDTVMCTEASSSYQRYAAIAMASRLSDMQLGDSVDIGQLVTKKELKQTRLECDQECATLERNRRLAEALQINSSTDPFNIRTASKYSDSLKEDARKDLKFVSEVEEEIKNLVELVNKGKQPKRSHCFPPMNREHRKIVHELAEAYAVESVSYDSEPKRNVVITAVRGKSVSPHSTLTALIERETSARAPPPIAHIKQHSSKGDNGSSWSKMLKEEPAIDYFDVQD